MKISNTILTFLIAGLLASCSGINTQPKKIVIKDYNLNATSGPINGYDYYNDKSPRVPAAAPKMKKEKTSKNTINKKSPIKK